MPTYVFECSKGHRFDIYLKLKDYNTTQKCKCGEDAHRITVPTMLSPDIAPWDAYVSPASGEYITSYKQRREDMRRTNSIDYDPSMKTEFEKERKNKEYKLDKKLDDTVDRLFEHMPSKKKEMLERELTHGVDLQYERGTYNG